MLNKILVFKNRKNNKNIENECGSDMWHKKPYFTYAIDFLESDKSMFRLI